MVCPTTIKKQKNDFSPLTREANLNQLTKETFDLLIIGGGITGAGVARDAATRGLKVALIEKNDFASGTSSKSSKLMHGGLRYLEHLEFGLVFEALSERTQLLENIPHLVKPLLFYLPTYSWNKHSKWFINIGLWIYDLLALGRAKKFHRVLSKEKILKDIPFLESNHLTGGLLYSDASMWDDVINVDNLRSASHLGSCIANYVEAIEPIWENNYIKGFTAIDKIKKNSTPFSIKAHKTIICAGPWTDLIGEKLKSNWHPWLAPSKGIHLVFDHQKIPIKEAMVMTNPEDGRVSFLIPRPDYGNGVTIVGTTDGPCPKKPEDLRIKKEDIDYLFELMETYIPKLNLKREDVISVYVGIKPLIQPHAGNHDDHQEVDLNRLQDVSREHQISRGPGGTVIVSGGKYTTYRTMAIEIVDFALLEWKKDAINHLVNYFPTQLTASNTKNAVFPEGLPENIKKAQLIAKEKNWEIPQRLYELYGSDALEIFELHLEYQSPSQNDPEGFPCLSAQLRYHIRNSMVIHLADFFLRRQPLYMARKDHGLPWVNDLALVLKQERNLSEQEMNDEITHLQKIFEEISHWKNEL